MCKGAIKSHMLDNVSYMLVVNALFTIPTHPFRYNMLDNVSYMLITNALLIISHPIPTNPL